MFFVLFSLICWGHSWIEKQDPQVYDRFLKYSGHWEIFDTSSRYIVVMLSSVGCTACASFEKKSDKFLKKLKKHKISLRLVDYLLYKRDIVAMSLIRDQKEEGQKALWHSLLTTQHRWMQNEKNIYATLKKEIKRYSKLQIKEPTTQNWSEGNEKQMKQRQSLDAIYEITALPFFFVIDKQRKVLIICDTRKQLNVFLKKNVYNQEGSSCNG